MDRLHNSPPAVDPDILAQERAKADEFEDTAHEWLRQIKDQGGALLNEEQAARLNDFLTGARRTKAEIDDVRKRERAYHDERAKAVQTLFLPLITTFDIIGGKLRGPLDAWMWKKDEEARAAQDAARQEAAAAMAEAERLAEAARDRGDISGEVAAAEAVKAAQKAQKEAAREVRTNVPSFTGGGRTVSLRTYRSARIKNIRAAFVLVQTHPRVIDAIQSAMNEMIRAKDFDGRDLPGIEIIEEKAQRVMAFQITADQARQVIEYDASTGLFYWNPRIEAQFAHAKYPEKATARFNKNFAGKEAFTAISAAGYKCGNLLGHAAYAHRVAFLVSHGRPPIGQIDHKNGIRTDNRISNLREVDQSLNNANARARAGSSQYKGVSWHPKMKKWCVQIKRKGGEVEKPSYYLSEEEAAKAYDILALKHFGVFARLNFPEQVIS